VLAHGIRAFTDTVMWPTVKSARRRILAPGNRAFTETVMWPTVTRVPSSTRPRFGSVFLIAVEMGRFCP
jgi:hypothetical protein